MHGDYKGVSIEYLIIPEGVHSIVFFGEIKLDYDFGNKNIFSIRCLNERSISLAHVYKGYF